MTSGEAYRSVWVSDVHLGSRECRIDLFLDFLDKLRCEHLYLVGDLIDLESMRRSFYWPSSHARALEIILDKARAGMRVTYIPGNHDEPLRALVGAKFGNIEILHECIHTTRAGRRLLVMHGDALDAAVACGPVLRAIGSSGYKTLLALNRLVHAISDLFGRPYWSLAQHVKNRMHRARRYVMDFVMASLRVAEEKGVDGVICGHIHRADLAQHDGLLYCNDGDWVESCTALVENARGELSLVEWQRLPAAINVRAAFRDAA